jgi:methionyl-tRNA formyltransferase
VNITLLANRDIASNLALNQLLPRLVDHRVTIFLSSQVGKKAGGPTTQLPPQALRDLRFIEQGLFNQLLSPLLATKQAAAGKPQLLSFAALGEQLGRPLQVLNNINSPAGLATFAASAPELAISIRYGVILRQPVIDVPPLGVVNLHSGLLPDYRGVMASFWALLNGAASLGTTLHYINDASIDTGRIIGHSHLPVNAERSYLWHVLNLYPAGCDMIADLVDQLAQDRAVTTTPQPAAGSYYTFPTAAELEEFSRRGLHLYDGDELLAFFGQYLPAPAAP